MLLNLLMNSIKFTDRDGKILLLVKAINRPDKVSDTLQISVTDSGCGIKKRHRSKLFKLFSQHKSSEGSSTNGIGMGLIVSNMIAGQFGGEVDFVSRYKRGSTFFF